MVNIAFDAATHTYRVDGRPARGVTSVLKASGMMPAFMLAHPDQYAMDRGTHAHKATEMYDAGGLDEDSLDAVLRPYLDGWKAWCKEVNWKPMGREVRMANAALGIAGTMDGHGFTRLFSQPVIVDIKTGDPAPWHGPQLGGYSLCMTTPHKLLGVYLGDDGRFRQKEYPARESEAVFMAALTLLNWKAEHNLP